MMKRYLACLLAIMMLCASGLAFAQEEPQRVFLGGTGDDSSGVPLVLEDQTLILPICSAGGRNGEAEYPHHARKVWLVQLSPSGKVMWETSFGEEKGYTSLSGLAVTADGELSGNVQHSINQVRQYRQEMRFSLLDGSITWQGEKIDDAAVLYPTDENGLRMSLNSYQLEDGRKFEEEIHDCEASCEPRLFRLLDENGGEVWTVNAKDAGLEQRRGQLVVPGGMLLYGFDWVEEDKMGYPTALLINDAGQPVWYLRMTELSGKINAALLDVEGRVVLFGSTDEYAPPEGEYGLGERLQNNELMLCLNPQTGDLLWRKENDMMQEQLPAHGRVIETDFGYLLADNNNQYTGVIYQAVGRNGDTLARWETKVPETTIIAPQLFRWGDEYWVEAIAEGLEVGMDVMLEKVEFPAAVTDGGAPGKGE